MSKIVYQRRQRHSFIWRILLVGALAIVSGSCWAEDSSPIGIPIVDINKLVLYGDDLGPNLALSYMDSEGNTPDTGEIRSTVEQIKLKEGNRTTSALHFTFHIPAGNRRYVGWYISSRTNAVNVSDRTVLRLEVKGTPGLHVDTFQLGVRSKGVSSSLNNAKVFMSELGWKEFPEHFTPIDIPVNLLLEKEPLLDLFKVNQLIIFAIVDPKEAVVNEELWIRNVRWAWDFQKTKRGLVATLPNILFDWDKSRLKPEVHPYLDRIAQALAADKTRWMSVEGHADITGSDEYNVKLSRKRAQVVADYLMALRVVSPDHVTIVGYGSKRPIASNQTEAGRSLNRRVEVVLTDHRDPQP